MRKYDSLSISFKVRKGFILSFFVNCFTLVAVRLAFTRLASLAKCSVSDLCLIAILICDDSFRSHFALFLQNDDDEMSNQLRNKENFPSNHIAFNYFMNNYHLKM